MGTVAAFNVRAADNLMSPTHPFYEVQSLKIDNNIQPLKSTGACSFKYRAT